MSEKQLNSSDTISESVILRHIFLESLASSPTIVSSSSPTNSLLSSPSDTNDVSIGTCIKYIRSRVSQTLSNDILDELENGLKKDAPNGRISWKMFKPIAQNWIASINTNDNKYQDGNNNLNKSTDDDTRSNPDGGPVESTPDISDDSSKSSELVEWSIISKNRTNNDTTNEYENTNDVLIKSPEQADSATGVEFRLRVRRLNEDNAWLRDELERTEELAAGYQTKFFSLRQRLEQTNEKRIQLERENEVQKEMINRMEEEEKRYLIALEKVDKERKLYAEKLEINRQMITNLNGKIDKMKNDKKNILNQLTTCKKKLNEKELMCDTLQDKNDELMEQNANLEEYYEKTVRNLQERSDDLKNENIKLYSRISSGHPSVELNMSSSMIHLNSSSESLPNDEHRVPFQNSLFEELKASGFSFEETQSHAKIQQLKEKLDWYNDEIFNAIEKLDTIIKQLGREPEPEDRKRLSDASESQTRYILILLDKITLISEAVKEIIEKPSTNDMSIQVSAEPQKHRGLREFNILTFEDGLNTSIVKRNPASGDSFNVYFTIGPALISKPDVETLPKSIYTSTEKLNRRRWGRKFNSIAVGTRSGDAPINDNSSPSPHSNTQLETKIILRSAMNIGDNNSRVNDATSPKFHTETNIGEDSYCESFSEFLSLSPICGTPNMSEKAVPKRKKSVYLRTYEIEKAFNTPHAMTERITSSTPGLDDNSDTSCQQIFASSEYRTGRNCSESSDSFSMPKLHPSIEEDISNDDISAFNEQSVSIAPPKLNLGIENEMKNLNITYPIQQDSMSSVSINDAVVGIGKSNIEILTNTHNDRDKVLESSPLSCINNVNNNFNGDSYTKNSSMPIDVTQTIQLNANFTSQQVSEDCDERAARKKRPVESVTIAMSSGDDSSDLSDSDATSNCVTTSGNESNEKQESIENKCIILGAVQSNVDDSIHAFSISFENNLPTSTTDFNNEILTNKHEVNAS
ncbi:hypothetical protein PV328_003492 [Microctonus aethiopoides]|uniref:Uncharacterized protein n=2 Tax=Microctonus aethiopoides TaxID=144406 RepID=A0AA39F8S0_9HYME|nr:hypothetical protein PV328_003492 [Microctonus aethiopoides]